MKNEQQRQNLLLKVDQRSTFRKNFFNPQQMLLIVARQVYHAICKARNQHRPKTCNETMLRDKLRVYMYKFFVDQFEPEAYHPEASNFCLYVGNYAGVFYLTNQKHGIISCPNMESVD